MFDGFNVPESNTTYCPNQFFDVCLPNYSRGVVRLVGYMLRRTLGWCDSEGEPQEAQIQISYSEICEKVGISRPRIKDAVRDAIHGRFIRCIKKGTPGNEDGQGNSATYELRWDKSGTYNKQPETFRGFFEKSGNRTYIPNEFFDVCVRKEPLSVVKIVGAVARLSIGFETKQGHRRNKIAVSFSHFRRYSKIRNRGNLAASIQRAIEKNYILQLREGNFTQNRTEQRANVFSLKWRVVTKRNQKLSSAEYLAERNRKEDEWLQKNGGSNKKVPEEQLQKGTRIEIKLEKLSRSKTREKEELNFGQSEDTTYIRNSKTLARGLKEKRKVNRPFKCSTWAEQFEMLERLDGVLSDRISNVLNWYIEHIGKPFVPEAFSARGFRNKFLQIEDAMMKRYGGINPVEISKDAEWIVDRIFAFEHVPFSKEQLSNAVQNSLDAYRAFRTKLLNIENLQVEDRIHRLAAYLVASIPQSCEYIETWIRKVIQMLNRPNNGKGCGFNFQSYITFSMDMPDFQEMLKQITISYGETLEMLSEVILCTQNEPKTR
uniref:Uncharacterized protein n=1 Tax=viral metagenome TaxID=1070528 RepID=A0A6M3IQB9_9ZZZZ